VHTTFLRLDKGLACILMHKIVGAVQCTQSNAATGATNSVASVSA